MMHLGVSDLRTYYFKCVRNSKAFLSHGPKRIFDEQQILLNTVQGTHVKSIFDEQQILYKLQNAYHRGLLCAPNNITFYDKRNGVLSVVSTRFLHRNTAVYTPCLHNVILYLSVSHAIRKFSYLQYRESLVILQFNKHDLSNVVGQQQDIVTSHTCDSLLILNDLTCV